MTIYTHADDNIRKTWLLLGIFLVFIICLGWLFSYAFGDQNYLIVATVFSLITSLASYWYSDKMVLALTRAKKVDSKENPELYRLLENLTIASGLPMPQLYLMEESQPNAFATGRDPKHGVVVVTRGLVEKLEKTELEGVLAHELSHIGNRDALLMAVVVILAGIVTNLADFFLRSNIGFQSRDDDSRANALLTIITVVLALLAPLAALLVADHLAQARIFSRRFGRSADEISRRPGPGFGKNQPRSFTFGRGLQRHQPPLHCQSFQGPPGGQLAGKIVFHPSAD